MRSRSVLLWVVAFVVALVAGRYQERTGPTYPVRGAAALAGQQYPYELTRSWDVGDQPVELAIADRQVQGRVRWRRYPTSDQWTEVQMRREGDTLRAALPHQPPAGKLEYQVELSRGDQRLLVPPKVAITRFKGPVSASILVPHIAFVFIALMFLVRAALEAALNRPLTRRYTFIGLLLFIVGAFVFGPLMQKAAFGAYWTGIPWGWDLTDNKVLFMGLAWLFAAGRVYADKSARWSVLFATAVALVVFLIPHSVWGSEIKWQ